MDVKSLQRKQRSGRIVVTQRDLNAAQQVAAAAHRAFKKASDRVDQMETWMKAFAAQGFPEMEVVLQRIIPDSQGERRVEHEAQGPTVMKEGAVRKVKLGTRFAFDRERSRSRRERAAV